MQHSVYSWWRSLWAAWGQHHKKGIDSLFDLVSREIWKEHNACCFREASSMVAELLVVIKAQAEQWVRAGAKDLGSLASGEG
jgi:hypothetical protein